LEQQLSDQCDQLIEWGKRHTYHWFWGITLVKPLVPAPTSISEKADFYANPEAIHVLRVEVVEDYRSRNPISRFFIWMFNYNDLVKKNIALTYIDIKSYATEVKENNMIAADERSPDLKKQVYQKLIEAGNTLGEQASSLGSAVKLMCFGITTFIKNRFLNEAQPEFNAAPANVQNQAAEVDQEKRIVCRNKLMQEALKVLDIACQIGDTYSEKSLKSQWRLLAKKHHPDHNGSPDKFRQLQEAKDLLDKFAKGKPVLQKRAPNNRHFSARPNSGVNGKANASKPPEKTLAEVIEARMRAEKILAEEIERAHALFKQIEINTKQREDEAKRRDEASKLRDEAAKQRAEASKQRAEASKRRAEASKLQAERMKRDAEEIQMLNEELAARGLGPLARRSTQDQNHEAIEESNEEHSASPSSASVSVTHVSIFKIIATSPTDAPELEPNRIEAENKEPEVPAVRTP
jgi:curved DNA-binding protein CbpA